MTRLIFARASKEGTSSQLIKTQLQQLRDEGLLIISPTVCTNVIYGMRHVNDRSSNERRSPYLEVYLALVELDREGSLGFELSKIIEDVLTRWRAGAVDETMQCLLQPVQQRQGLQCTLER